MTFPKNVKKVHSLDHTTHPF